MTVAWGDDVTPELLSLAAIHGGGTERWNESGKTVLAARIIFGLFLFIIFTTKRLYSKHLHDLPRKGDQGETQYAFMCSFLLIILFMFLFGGILVLCIGLLARRIMFTTDFLGFWNENKKVFICQLRQNLKPYGV
jgi:hypothetical protein